MQRQGKPSNIFDLIDHRNHHFLCSANRACEMRPLQSKETSEKEEEKYILVSISVIIFEVNKKTIHINIERVERSSKKRGN